MEGPQSGPFECVDLALLAGFFRLVFESVPSWLQVILSHCG
jgi:hypothetical protein